MRERVSCFTLMYSWCLLTVRVLWLFLTEPWVGLQCVIVTFPDHAHLRTVPLVRHEHETLKLSHNQLCLRYIVFPSCSADHVI